MKTIFFAALTLMLAGCAREGRRDWKQPGPDNVPAGPIEEAPRPERVG